MEETNLTDYWNDVHQEGGLAPRVPRVLSPGEMLDRIYRSIHALWAVDTPWASDKPPAINIRVTPPDTKSASPCTSWQATLEAPGISNTETGQSYEEALTKLHKYMAVKHHNMVKAQQAEILKKREEIAKIEKTVGHLTGKMERYQRVLDTHTT